MKTPAILLMLVLLLGALPELGAQPADTLNPQSDSRLITLEVGPEKSAGFFETFIKTPFVTVSLFATLSSCAIAGFFELMHNLFCGFDCGFPVTRNLWHLGWDVITVEWWWKPGINWQLILSFVFWSAALPGSRWKSRKRRDE
ncbi:MAG: hypothetical protein NW241_00175 [Bacteroidia bacterium]|nr:hypothetical protein [Bacteroidia bacterium]